MGEYSFTVHVKAPPELVFDLFTDIDRMPEWIGGVSRITDVTGPAGEAGTSYTVWFGRMPSPTRILAATRPSHVRSRFGNRLLRGEMEAELDAEGGGTLLTQRFKTEGFVPAIVARIFAIGSYRGSFRGELATFAAMVEREAGSTPAPPPPGPTDS